MEEHNATLEILKEGIRRFHSEVYLRNRKSYETAEKEPQQPHTLLITCADSRIDPEAITSSGPGDIFVARNIGNMVPPYGGMIGGVSAVIEYAVDVLKVRNAVVCGHTDCGAMKSMLHPEKLELLPVVKAWLQSGAAAMRIAESVNPHKDDTAFLPVLTEQNILLQMAHLGTHPSVAGAMARKQLTISGWIYDIGGGDIRIFDEAEKRFVSVIHNGDS